jgi:DNA-binding NarL/FixJ family response regulator
MSTAQAPGARRRVVVADDDVLLREGIASLLGEVGYDVIERAGDARTLTEAVRRGQPDLVIADIRMPPTHTSEGIDVARAIRAEFPQIGVLLLSAHVELETAIDFLQSGERIGYLLKNRIAKIDDLVDALERIANGGAVIDPVLVSELLAQRRKSDPLTVLSPREREVLALMAEGRSNSGIARKLWVSEGAVEKHVRSILAKLQLSATEEDHRRVLAVLTFLDVRLPDRRRGGTIAGTNGPFGGKEFRILFSERTRLTVLGSARPTGRRPSCHGTRAGSWPAGARGRPARLRSPAPRGSPGRRRRGRGRARTP